MDEVEGSKLQAQGLYLVSPINLCFAGLRSGSAIPGPVDYWQHYVLYHLTAS